MYMMSTSVCVFTTVGSLIYARYKSKGQPNSFRIWESAGISATTAFLLNYIVGLNLIGLGLTSVNGISALAIFTLF